MSISPGAALSQLLGFEVAAGLNTLSGLLNLIPQGNLGGIAIQATIEEVLTDTMEVTQHPVQKGALISDHTYMRLPEVVIRCGWSNSQPTSIGASISAAAAFAGGQLSVHDYVSGIYSQLLQLQQNQTVFSIITTARQYTSMVLTSLVVNRDFRTSQALMVTATCRQVLIASLSSAQLPPITNLANPPSMAETVNTGAQSLSPGNPSSGGSVPPNVWNAPPSGVS
jgi:hypothetical protein